MSKKKYDDDPLTGWDGLILIILGALIVTITLAITSGLSWLWPLGYFVALCVAVPVSIKNDEKQAAGND